MVRTKRIFSFDFETLHKRSRFGWYDGFIFGQVRRETVLYDDQRWIVAVAIAVIRYRRRR